MEVVHYRAAAPVPALQRQVAGAAACMPLNEREICSRWPAASTTSGSQAMDIHQKEKSILRRTQAWVAVPH